MVTCCMVLGSDIGTVKSLIRSLGHSLRDQRRLPKEGTFRLKLEGNPFNKEKEVLGQKNLPDRI